MMKELKYCPSTLSKGFNTYSPTALKRVFNGRKVSHILKINPPQIDENVAEQFRQNRKSLSISGVQIKQSFRLNKNKMVITQEGEQGQYILKPIPHRETIGKVELLPANEHLTMQIARQVYKMDIAENALVFFKNGEPAYLTKRFDVLNDGRKLDQEDFATLLGRTRDTHGDFFKNEGSYEMIAEVMKTCIAAYIVEIEKFFLLVLFNYLFSNGDAHLKNFSIQITKDGDYKLAPAYDLINTKIHIKGDTAMALSNGLFEGEVQTESFTANGFYAYDDFYEFGLRVGIIESRVRKILDFVRSEKSEVNLLVEHSFLNKEAKELYLEYYYDRLRALNYSYTKRV